MAGANPSRELTAKPPDAMRPRRILHVSTTINRGGAENHLLDLVGRQVASGMDVTVAYLRGHYREMGVPTHNLALRFYGDLRPLHQLQTLIAASDFDLVHAHLPPAELYVRLALLGIGRRELPLVITKHNEERFAPIPGQRLLGRWVGRRAARVIAISEAVKRYISGSALGLDARKIQTIYYGIDAAPFARVPAAEVADLRKEWGIADGELVVGFVGRLVPQKDIATLLRGFAKFAAQFAPARLVIVGHGPLESELRQCAAEAQIAHRVVWAGFREDIHRVMNAFDIFALTSIYEGLGLVLLEAMAAARPVIGTRVGAIPEVVVDGRTGLLVEPGQPEQVATALQRLCDVEFRQQLGTEGQRQVSEAFTLEAMYRQTDDLYRTCSQRAGVTRAVAQDAIADAAM
jgi:glycosyltransferase involved in cell wall biosynthesis